MYILYRILYPYSLELNSLIDRYRGFIQPVFLLNTSATSIQAKKYSPTVYTLYTEYSICIRFEMNSALDRYRNLI